MKLVSNVFNNAHRGHLFWDGGSILHSMLSNSGRFQVTSRCFQELIESDPCNRVWDSYIRLIILNALQEPACSAVCWEIMDVPLGLPRCLTIPVVEDNRWSRPFAIASATLAPTLLAGVRDSNDGEPFGSTPGVYAFGFFLGIVLGGLAYFSL